MLFRSIGEDIKNGDTVLQKGRQIKPCDLGLLASLGIDSIQVYRKIKVASFQQVMRLFLLVTQYPMVRYMTATATA